GLYKLLGNDNLRVGADSAETTGWMPPNGTGTTGTTGTTTPANIDAFSAFIKAANWNVFYALNVRTSTAAIEASEAAYAAKDLGSSLVAFAVGNEPDAYILDEPTYVTTFNQYVSAIRALVPNAA